VRAAATRHASPLIASALLLLHLAVQLVVRPYPRWLDGIVVFRYARDFPHIPMDHYSMRIGLVLPARLFIALFGYGQVAYYAWPLICGCVLVVATYLLANELGGRWAGAVAGVLIIFNPMLVETNSAKDSQYMTSWQLLPDVGSAAWFTAGMACLLIAVRERRDDDDRPLPARRGWLVAAGLLFGFAYLIREFIPFVYPTIVVVLLLWKVPWRRWAWVAGAMVSCLLLEVVLAAAVHGHPLGRLTLGADKGDTTVFHQTRLDTVTTLWTAFAHYPFAAGLLGSVILTVLAPLLLRRREALVPAAWVVFLWIPMTLATGFLRPQRIWIVGAKPRYWLPILPAAAVGCGLLAAALGAWLATRVGPLARQAPARRALAVLALVAGAVIYALPVRGALLHNPRDHSWNGLRAWLHDHDGDVGSIVTDSRDALNLSIYRFAPVGGEPRWDADVTTVPLHSRRPPRASAGGADALLWSQWLSPHPPTRGQGWRLAWHSGQLRLYLRGDTATPSS